MAIVGGTAVPKSHVVIRLMLVTPDENSVEKEDLKLVQWFWVKITNISCIFTCI